MTYQVHDSVLDAALNLIKNNADRLVLVSAAPANFAAVAAVTLGAIAVDSTDFTVADGTSGRKLTCQAQTGVTVSATGPATHICVVDDGGSVLLVTVPIATVNLTNGVNTNIGEFIAYQINDPAELV